MEHYKHAACIMSVQGTGHAHLLLWSRKHSGVGEVLLRAKPLKDASMHGAGQAQQQCWEALAVLTFIQTLLSLSLRRQV